MVELIGDPCIPNALVIPKNEGALTLPEGGIILSGNKLWFHNGTSMVIVTSG